MTMDDLLKLTLDKGASHLHVKVGSVPILRINGELAPQTQLPAVTAADARQMLETIATADQKAAFYQELELDFAYAMRAARFRVNTAYQEGGISFVCHPVPAQVPSMEECGVPEVCKSLILKRSGLVLVTGPTGSGKTTTLASMLEYLNQTEKRTIVTIEDPIEFIHRDRLCVFSQRELGRDTRSFASAIKHALRQDPNVILVGEMRDLETMAATLTAAETGHLVLATLHARGATQAIERFVDVFPAHQQAQVRLQLSATLEGVLYQILAPRKDGVGRVAVFETMVVTPAVKNLIRETKTYQILNVLQTGAKFGMHTLNQSLITLVQRGIITRDVAFSRSTNPEELAGVLGSNG